MDYSKIETTSAAPKASSMVETFRAIGYSLETAVADIIDNSISADARNIWINRIWRGGRSFITIKDDGHGMTSQEVIQAMRPGSQNPRDERSEKDLGRFGLGLKTASFSQCRKVSVFSKRKDYAPAFWTWDLDFVAATDNWDLLKWMPDEFSNELDEIESGTLVIWSDLDREVRPNVSESDVHAHEKFSRDLDHVKKHIAMTFHRFIEDKAIKLYWCGNEIESWNPFCPNESKRQLQTEDHLPGNVTVRGYVLPHKKNFSSEKAYNDAEGMNGWTAHQGFYIYRGKRLLLAGNWLGMFKQEEPYKLVRIQVDIPNTQDSEWKIDIKKSQAYPPASCRELLESYARTVRRQGMEVYKHRGRILKQKAGASFQPLWLDKKKDGKWYFVVNRENEVIARVKEMAKTNPDSAIETLLRFVEESVPTNAVYANKVENEATQKDAFEGFDTDSLLLVAQSLYDSKIASGLSPEEARESLKSIAPFNEYEDLIESLS